MLEGQVDDPVGRRSGGAQRLEVVEGPADDLGAGRGESGGRGVGAGEPDDLVPRADELGDDDGADPAGGTGDENAHERARRRQLVIAANAELRERELVKLASVAAALAVALRERGVAEPTASITAETAIAVFRNAFERWVAPADQQELPTLLRESLQALQAVTAGG